MSLKHSLFLVTSLALMNVASAANHVGSAFPYLASPFAPTSCGHILGFDSIHVALSSQIMSKWMDKQCGQMVTVKWEGKSINAIVDNSCDSCGPNDILLSQAGVMQLTGFVGMKAINVEWDFMTNMTPDSVDISSHVLPSPNPVTPTNNTAPAPPASSPSPVNNPVTVITASPNPTSDKPQTYGNAVYTTYSGDMTCGGIRSDPLTQYVGLSVQTMSNNPQDKHCGKKVSIQFNGVTKVFPVYGVCYDCGPKTILLSSPAFFSLTGSLLPGNVDISWSEVSDALPSVAASIPSPAPVAASQPPATNMATAITSVVLNPGTAIYTEYIGDLTCGTKAELNTQYVALSIQMMTSASTDSHCGQMVTIEYAGKSQTLRVQGTCVGCDSKTILLSKPAFIAVTGSLEPGKIPITWGLVSSTQPTTPSSSVQPITTTSQAPIPTFNAGNSTVQTNAANQTAPPPNLLQSMNTTESPKPSVSVNATMPVANVSESHATSGQNSTASTSVAAAEPSNISQASGAKNSTASTSTDDEPSSVSHTIGAKNPTASTSGAKNSTASTSTTTKPSNISQTSGAKNSTQSISASPSNPNVSSAQNSTEAVSDDCDSETVEDSTSSTQTTHQSSGRGHGVAMQDIQRNSYSIDSDSSMASSSRFRRKFEQGLRY